MSRKVQAHRPTMRCQCRCWSEALSLARRAHARRTRSAGMETRAPLQVLTQATFGRLPRRARRSRETGAVRRNRADRQPYRRRAFEGGFGRIGPIVVGAASDSARLRGSTAGQRYGWRCGGHESIARSGQAWQLRLCGVVLDYRPHRASTKARRIRTQAARRGAADDPRRASASHDGIAYRVGQKARVRW